MKNRILITILLISILSISGQIPSLITDGRGFPIAEDMYEENDVFSNAAYLSMQSYSDYLEDFCQADDDWFYFSLPIGVSNISILYNGSLTNLNLELYNDTQGLLNQSTLVGVNCQSILINNTGYYSYYYLKISGDNLAEAYAIEIIWIHALVDDTSEENDNWFRAASLFTGEESYFACDYDWYKFAFQNLSKIVISLDWNYTMGYMEMIVYTQYRNYFLGDGQTTGHFQITFITYDLGLYYFKISSSSPGIQVPYNLTFSYLEDDWYENNDDSLTASLLSEGNTTNLIKADEEYYKVWVPAFTTINLTIDYDTNLYYNYYCFYYYNNQGNNGPYQTVLQNNPIGQFWIIYINGNTDEFANYSLSIEFSPGEDQYEPNNEFAVCPEIYDESIIEGVLRDEDLFKFWSIDGKTPYLRLQYNDSEYTHNIQVFNAAFDLVSRDESNRTTKILEFPTVSPGCYYIRLFGNYTGINYTLFLDIDGDDRYEQNDVLENATVIVYDIMFDERLVLRDRDWYRIELLRQGTCTFRIGYDINSNMSFTLYNGETMEEIELIGSTSFTSGPWIEYSYNQIPARSKNSFVLLEFESNVSNSNRWEYTLSITKDQIYDSLEPYDDIHSAYPLFSNYFWSTSLNNLYADYLNEDWYKIEYTDTVYQPMLIKFYIFYDKSDGYLEIGLLGDPWPVLNSSTLEHTIFSIEIYQKCRFYLYIRNLNDTFCPYYFAFNTTYISNNSIGYPFQDIPGFVLPVVGVSCVITVLIIVKTVSIPRYKNKKRHSFRDLNLHYYKKGGH